MAMHLMEDNEKLDIGRRAKRVIAASIFLGLLVLWTPAYAYRYGVGLYGAGLYNVGQLSVTTTTLVSGTNPSTYGSSITLTATVSSTSATGSITFKNGSTTIGTAAVGHGSGSLVISTLGAGSRSL